MVSVLILILIYWNLSNGSSQWIKGFFNFEEKKRLFCLCCLRARFFTQIDSPSAPSSARPWPHHSSVHHIKINGGERITVVQTLTNGSSKPCNPFPFPQEHSFTLAPSAPRRAATATAVERPLLGIILLRLTCPPLVFPFCCLWKN